MMQVHEPTVRTRTWPIGDMVSTGCARTLEKAVAALPGVNATSANFATATLQVSYDPARLSAGAVATAIRDCGFQCNAPMPDADPASAPGGDAGAASIPAPAEDPMKALEDAMKQGANKKP